LLVFAEAKVSCRTIGYFAGLLFVSMLPSGSLFGQGVCDQGNGPLNPARPSGITPAEIIQKFAAKEATFKTARDRYGYTLNVTVQTLDSYGRVDGEYQQISEITVNDSGRRVEKTTFAPQSTLRRLSLSEDDLDDIRDGCPFRSPRKSCRASRSRIPGGNAWTSSILSSSTCLPRTQKKKRSSSKAAFGWTIRTS
jgi:hypothetical protein